jgi:hypothetical protein
MAAIHSSLSSPVAKFRGYNWVSRSSGVTQDLISVAYGNGIFVAVGHSNGTAGVIITSPDGITWSPQTSGYNRNIKTVIWTGSEFWAYASDMTVGRLLKSTTGIGAWTVVDVGFGGNVFRLIPGDNCAFVAKYQTIIGRTNGTTSTTHSFPDIIVGVIREGTQYLAVSATGEVWRSTDGVVWPGNTGFTGEFVFSNTTITSFEETTGIYSFDGDYGNINSRYGGVYSQLPDTTPIDVFRYFSKQGGRGQGMIVAYINPLNTAVSKVFITSSLALSGINTTAPNITPLSVPSTSRVYGMAYSGDTMVLVGTGGAVFTCFG